MPINSYIYSARKKPLCLSNGHFKKITCVLTTRIIFSMYTYISPYKTLQYHLKRIF